MVDLGGPKNGNGGKLKLYWHAFRSSEEKGHTSTGMPFLDQSVSTESTQSGHHGSLNGPKSHAFRHICRVVSQKKKWRPLEWLQPDKPAFQLFKQNLRITDLQSETVSSRRIRDDKQQHPD